jgi:hypothetical protein
MLSLCLIKHFIVKMDVSRQLLLHCFISEQNISSIYWIGDCVGLRKYLGAVLRIKISASIGN